MRSQKCPVTKIKRLQSSVVTHDNDISKFDIDKNIDILYHFQYWFLLKDKYWNITRLQHDNIYFYFIENFLTC